MNGETRSSYLFYYLAPPDNDPDHRVMDVVYATDDTSLFEAGSSLNIVLNGIRLDFNSSTEYDTRYVARGVDGLIVSFGSVTEYGTSISFTASYLDDVEMYRLYNPNSSEHFYTADEGERGYLINLGWDDEGIGWYGVGCA
ncbi:MAG: hypothetical protein K6A37_07640 [Saccharofermentans sp.]|nr:hypothetical protein [Saccharofermentans sp.]